MKGNPAGVTELYAYPERLMAKVDYYIDGKEAKYTITYTAYSGQDPKLDKLLLKLCDYIISQCPEISWAEREEE